jgi:hypothetical protein
MQAASYYEKEKSTLVIYGETAKFTDGSLFRLESIWYVGLMF